MTDATTPANSGSKDWFAFITYLFPIFLIYTMIKKGNDPRYVWHSKNAAGALVIYLAIEIIVKVFINFVGLGIFFTILNLLSLVNLVVLILTLYAGWKALNGALPTIPLITTLGQKIPLEKWFKEANVAASAQSAAAPAPAPSPAPMAAPMQTPAAPATPAPTEPTPPAPTTQA